MPNLNKPTLVVLAAGMGSRYGGLKQTDVLTKEGETILDFSIYDAIQAGFGKVVFIIRKSFEEKFREFFQEKLKDKIQVAYVFQEVDAIPNNYINSNRSKPWGTGHAVLMAKSVVKENFAVINADDFYGKEAFEIMAKNLSNKDLNSFEFSMISYRLKNTLSDFGYVSRGECKVDTNDNLLDITERTHIEKIDGKLVTKLKNECFQEIDKNTVVSMNFWGFTKIFFYFAEELFSSFLDENSQNLKAEFYIPSIVKNVIDSKKGSVKVLTSNSKWFGITYQQDKEVVQKAIKKLKATKIYPKKLW